MQVNAVSCPIIELYVTYNLNIGLSVGCFCNRSVRGINPHNRQGKPEAKFIVEVNFDTMDAPMFKFYATKYVDVGRMGIQLLQRKLDPGFCEDALVMAR